MKKILYNIIAICTFVINSFAQAPTISSFTPSSGSIGTLVTITGTNLNNIDSIKIGGVTAIKVSSTSTNLVAMVMPGTLIGAVYLKNTYGNTTSNVNFTIKPNSFPSIQQEYKLLPNSNKSEYIGEVSISADGNTAIIGIPGGALILFRIGNTWSQQGILPRNSLNVLRETSVSISADGNTAIIGNGNASVYNRTSGIWSNQGIELIKNDSVGDYYNNVSISADGNNAIVGGYSAPNNSSSVWIFKRIGNLWIKQGNKLSVNGMNGIQNGFGESVSISADGNTAIVGGYRDNSQNGIPFGVGAAWIFTQNNGVWTQQGNKLIGSGATGDAGQGEDVALNANGTTAIVSGIYDNGQVGATWVFVKNGDTWTQQKSKLIGIGKSGNAVYQGASISINADGNVVLIGSPNDNLNIGATWIFTRTNNTWFQQGNKLVGFNGIEESYQGISVAISADGNTTIICGKGEYWIFTSANTASKIETNTTTFTNINLKPNPFTNGFEISFNSIINETINLVILDAVGKEVYSKNIESNIGENSITLNELNYLKSGFYFARLTNNDGISQLIKMVKN